MTITTAPPTIQFVLSPFPEPGEPIWCWSRACVTSRASALCRMEIASLQLLSSAFGASFTLQHQWQVDRVPNHGRAGCWACSCRLGGRAGRCASGCGCRRYRSRRRVSRSRSARPRCGRGAGRRVSGCWRGRSGLRAGRGGRPGGRRHVGVGGGWRGCQSRRPRRCVGSGRSVRHRHRASRRGSIRGGRRGRAGRRARRSLASEWAYWSPSPC